MHHKVSQRIFYIIIFVFTVVVLLFGYSKWQTYKQQRDFVKAQIMLTLVSVCSGMARAGYGNHAGDYIVLEDESGVDLNIYNDNISSNVNGYVEIYYQNQAPEKNYVNCAVFGKSNVIDVGIVGKNAVIKNYKVKLPFKVYDKYWDSPR